MIDSNNRIWNLTLKLDPKLCLLGWLDEQLYMPHTSIAILRVLFMTRKLIAQKWLSTTSPSYEEWITMGKHSFAQGETSFPA